uniref:Major facilitator superfamily (MFS) profile domain-containing protein n=1 Tax=Thermosporothrix sp. COM3 TaxID=2490863 RepID=A0A455SNR4_9CHLR|nr:hypothetical protein KTC_37990 [Thermosporothrix sp. COM3]
MFSLLFRCDVLLFRLGRFVADLTGSASGIVLPLLVLQLTGLVLSMGLMMLISFLPEILFGTVAGLLVDRLDRRKVLIGCELCSAAAVLPLLFPQGGAMIWLIYGVYLVQSFSGLFFNPASRAFIPQLVENEQLVAMNSLVSTCEALIRIIGPVVGGALFVLLGLQPVLLLELGGFSFRP